LFASNGRPTLEREGKTVGQVLEEEDFDSVTHGKVKLRDQEGLSGY